MRKERISFMSHNILKEDVIYMIMTTVMCIMILCTFVVIGTITTGNLRAMEISSVIAVIYILPVMAILVSIALMKLLAQAIKKRI